MKKARPLPLEDEAHLVEPPIVDFLHHHPARRAYVVTFVPEDSVSHAETEVVEIPDASGDGLRIKLQLDKLARLLNSRTRIERLTHSGGGNFEIRFEGGKTKSLSTSPSPDATFGVYSSLQDIAMTAQIAFIAQHRTPASVVA
ncbi:MAG TPA: hypothetical protein VKX17_15530 [Planctomycetota bacterium]|nr:hypothetical protein [Planctomycetota bacterium]